jgi:alpha-mannosidase/mannosylglycerate hydrolase
VHGASGTRIEDAVRVVSEGDRGDTYNFDPVPEEGIAEGSARARVRVEHASASSATLRVDLRLRLPQALAPDRRQRSARSVTLPITLRLRVLAGLDRIELHVTGNNTAWDHRLRLHVRAPFTASRFEVESAFEVVERPIAPARDSFGSAAPAEFPVGACPQRSFAALADETLALSVAARGNGEVEAVPEPDGTTSIALTLLRAVGWLSGSDLALRPGPAGPLFETPGAQVPGPFAAGFSLRLHRPDERARVAEAHRFAWPPLAFALGDGPPGTELRDGARLVVIDDPAIVVSAFEPGAEGRLHLRLYEALGRARRLVGRIPGAVQIRALDLAGREDRELPLTGAGEAFEAELRAGQIVDLEASFAP